MSDTYDYAYIHVMRHPTHVNTYTVNPKENTIENEIDASNFSARDLNIFVDSLEAISRIAQARHDRRQKRKIKINSQTSKPIVTNLDASIIGTSDDDDESRSFSTSEPDYLYDETYFGVPHKLQSTALYYSHIPCCATSPAGSYTSQSLHSDSEESGIFLNNTSDSHLYENINPIRPRSKVITHPKCRSLKSRLIGLIMKRHYAQPAAPSIEMLSSTTIGEQTEEKEIYDRILDDAIKKQFKKPNKKAYKPKGSISSRKRPEVSPEETFLDKAMRFLTI